VGFVHAQIINPRASRSTILRVDITDGGGTNSSPGRRKFLSSFASLVGGISSSCLVPSGTGAATPREEAKGGVDYRAVAADIEELITRVPYRGPPLVRLAWHSSGTYDRISRTGGSGGGTIRFQEELDHKENVGLIQPVKWLEKIKVKYGDGLSYADLYTLAGGGSYVPACGSDYGKLVITLKFASILPYWFN